MKSVLFSLLLVSSAVILSAVTSISTAVAATPPLSEILTQSNCKPQRLNRKGQVQKFDCINAKSDSVQMQGLQGTAAALSGQDEFAKFENEATDLSHVHDTETEVEVE